jgi:hypothetical protein
VKFLLSHIIKLALLVDQNIMNFALEKWEKQAQGALKWQSVFGTRAELSNGA